MPHPGDSQNAILHHIATQPAVPLDSVRAGAACRAGRVVGRTLTSDPAAAAPACRRRWRRRWRRSRAARSGPPRRCPWQPGQGRRRCRPPPRARVAAGDDRGGAGAAFRSRSAGRGAVAGMEDATPGRPGRVPDGRRSPRVRPPPHGAPAPIDPAPPRPRLTQPVPSCRPPGRGGADRHRRGVRTSDRTTVAGRRATAGSSARPPRRRTARPGCPAFSRADRGGARVRRREPLQVMAPAVRLGARPVSSSAACSCCSSSRPHRRRRRAPRPAIPARRRPRTTRAASTSRTRALRGGARAVQPGLRHEPALRGALQHRPGADRAGPPAGGDRGAVQAICATAPSRCRSAGASRCRRQITLLQATPSSTIGADPTARPPPSTARGHARVFELAEAERQHDLARRRAAHMTRRPAATAASSPAGRAGATPPDAAPAGVAARRPPRRPTRPPRARQRMRRAAYISAGAGGVAARRRARRLPREPRPLR